MKYKIIKGQYPMFDLPWVLWDKRRNHVAEFVSFKDAQLFRKYLLKFEKSKGE